MKKIVFSTPANAAGGAERVITTLANYASRHGYDVVYVNLDRDSHFYPLENRVRQVKLGLCISGKGLRRAWCVLITEFARFFAIRRLLKEEKPDYVVAFLKVSEMMFGLNAISLKLPFITSIRNDLSMYSGVLPLFRKYFYPKARLVVCQTGQIKEQLDRAVTCRSCVIPNPVSNTAVNPQPCGKRTRRVIGVGRLCEQKNFDLLITAFSRLPSPFSEYTLDIFGEGPDRAKLQARIEALGLQGRVRLCGTVENALAKNHDASLYVMSSDYEGFPNTLLEAMSNGIPSISTDFQTGAARELIGSNERGWLFPVGDEDALVHAMCQALCEPEKAEEIANSAKSFCLQYSEEVVCEQWLNMMTGGDAPFEPKCDKENNR